MGNTEIKTKHLYNNIFILSVLRIFSADGEETNIMEATPL